MNINLCFHSFTCPVHNPPFYQVSASYHKSRWETRSGQLTLTFRNLRASQQTTSLKFPCTNDVEETCSLPFPSKFPTPALLFPITFVLHHRLSHERNTMQSTSCNHMAAFNMQPRVNVLESPPPGFHSTQGAKT